MAGTQHHHGASDDRKQAWRGTGSRPDNVLTQCDSAIAAIVKQSSNVRFQGRAPAVGGCCATALAACADAGCRWAAAQCTRRMRLCKGCALCCRETAVAYICQVQQNLVRAMVCAPGTPSRPSRLDVASECKPKRVSPHLALVSIEPERACASITTRMTSRGWALPLR